MPLLGTPKVSSALLQLGYFFTVQVFIGSPLYPEYLAMDIGSPLIWTQCQPSTLNISYGDSSSSKGIFSTETFRLPQNPLIQVPDIAFGCGQDNETSIKVTQGVLGMNLSPVSLVNQLKEAKRRFSYCLIEQSASLLRFGDNASFGGRDYKTIPIS
ncbi:hypothetical protein L6164_033263 [Bauhinia variegata]|uniref:Uncharacterized protein n=1 Tax=Bauhinia variegata TaxID=167791 RepID=A0ACB9KR61_BAUVA|nr:hypothetical protein L6164_033263 [Bauhinia variegata]